MNLVEMLHRNARVFGEKPALRYGGNSISFAELAKEAARAAGWLRAQGVRKRDRVAVMSLNTPAFVTALYGALQAGAAVVPINHKLTAPETDYILKHSGANVFLFDGALAKVAGGLSADV
ncbi:MAG: AMP-binding protein, partial [Desulfococcaceae bacterium]